MAERAPTPLLRPRPAWGALTVLAPQIALGTYLAVVPDRIAFTAAQVVTLAHVVTGLFTFPLFIAWLWIHTKGRRLRRPAGEPLGGTAHLVVRHLLALLGFLAFASGLGALWTGEGVPLAAVHAALGLAPAVPLAAHLWMEKRPVAAALIGSSLLAVLLASLTIQRVVPGQPESPVTPPWTYQLRPTVLYEDPAWCGSCHTEIFAEWRRSTHARSLRIPAVKTDFTKQMKDLGPVFVDSDLHALKEGTKTGQCSHCHTPTTFYGDDPTPLLESKPPTSDGVPCSFCHTLRGLWPDKSTTAEGGFQPRYYLTGPETVRRYFWQAANSPWLRAMGDLLIQWRPEMHRRDYHPAFLDKSEACLGCHGLNPGTTYDQWKASAYNGTDEKTRVACQDCHMVKEFTGKAVVEPGRFVSWGPERRQRRTHLWLGGNVQALTHFGDDDMIRKQRELARTAMSLRVERATRVGSELRVRVVVKNEKVGHSFPGLETSQRVGWLGLSALLADGTEVAEATMPVPGSKEDAETPRKNEGALIYGKRDEQERIIYDTTVPALSERAFDLVLDAGPRAAEVTKVRAKLNQTFDPDPFATATGEVR